MHSHPCRRLQLISADVFLDAFIGVKTGYIVETVTGYIIDSRRWTRRYSDALA
jgi:hypothetical protein